MFTNHELIERNSKNLEKLLKFNQTNGLTKAIHYAVLNHGKRIRPLLTYRTGESLGLAIEILDSIACAIEVIHCYSLVHDDLPGMDNADTRRGKASCHKAFDEASAILVGDALIPLAFELLSDITNIDASNKVKMIKLLAECIGVGGMVTGQYYDTHGLAPNKTQKELENINDLKTGSLFQATMLLPAIAADCNQATFDQIKQIAILLGRIFQIKDDLIDIETTTEMSGKPMNQDNNTLPRIIGIEATKAIYDDYVNQVFSLIKNNIAKPQNLLQLCETITTRQC